MTKITSLRERIIAAGITDEREIRAALGTALNVVRNVPGVKLDRYNPRRPMQGVHEG